MATFLESFRNRVRGIIDDPDSKSWQDIVDELNANPDKLALFREKCGGATPSTPEIKPDFSCPICESTEFQAEIIYHESMPGVYGYGNKITEEITGYHCAGCTVRFANLEKFSKK